MKTKLYKNKYLIGIYNCEHYNDSLIALLDNSSEFAEFMNISIYQACVTLKRVYDKKITHIVYRGKLAEIFLIDFKQQENEDI